MAIHSIVSVVSCDVQRSSSLNHMPVLFIDARLHYLKNSVACYAVRILSISTDSFYFRF